MTSKRKPKDTEPTVEIDLTDLPTGNTVKVTTTREEILLNTGVIYTLRVSRLFGCAAWADIEQELRERQSEILKHLRKIMVC